MAPHIKFKREEMVNAALRLVQTGGIDSLTAKTLAAELGISTQPVFTCFGSMDVLKQEVYAAAEKRYDIYAEAGLKQKLPFFGFGMQYILFARHEPELYRLLFLSRIPGQEHSVIRAMQHSQEIVRPTLMQVYHLTSTEADRYFRDLWLATHGIATLIVTGDCPYTDEEIRQIMTGFSLSICKAIKEVPGFAENTYDRDVQFRALVADKSEQKSSGIPTDNLL